MHQKIEMLDSSASDEKLIKKFQSNMTIDEIIKHDKVKIIEETPQA